MLIGHNPDIPDLNITVSFELMLIGHTVLAKFIHRSPNIYLYESVSYPAGLIAGSNVAGRPWQVAH